MGAMKPYMHELTIRVRFFKDDSMSAKYIGRDSYVVNLDYIRKDEGSSENVVTIANLVIPPQAEVIITFGIKKSMMQFEQYPNDPQRGFNIMHTPILYREFFPRSTTEADLDVRPKLPW